MATSGNLGRQFSVLLRKINLSRGLLFGLLIIAALLAFEVFNYSTTDYALSDLLGGLKFAGVRWATILAIAFCGIDFAGIARLFTPEEGSDEPKEVWYLFGAWLLAATMNAMLTWWAVSLAVLGQGDLGNAIVQRPTLLRVVPVFVAVIVWLVRVLIIGTFSVAGERLFSQADRPVRSALPGFRPAQVRGLGKDGHALPNSARLNAAPTFRPSPKATLQEPTYHSASLSSPKDGSSPLPRR
jgi:hypothetical protein